MIDFINSFPIAKEARSILAALEVGAAIPSLGIQRKTLNKEWKKYRSEHDQQKIWKKEFLSEMEFKISPETWDISIKETCRRRKTPPRREPCIDHKGLEWNGWEVWSWSVCVRERERSAYRQREPGISASGWENRVARRPWRNAIVERSVEPQWAIIAPDPLTPTRRCLVLLAWHCQTESPPPSQLNLAPPGLPVHGPELSWVALDQRLKLCRRQIVSFPTSVEASFVLRPEMQAASNADRLSFLPPSLLPFSTLFFTIGKGKNGR